MNAWRFSLERFYCWLAWVLPERLVFWCTMRFYHDEMEKRGRDPMEIFDAYDEEAAQKTKD